MRGLRGKVVVVTGGAGGIGSAICRRFADEGASVAVFDINKDAGEKVVEGIRSGGATHRAYAVDLTSQQSVTEAVAQAERELGRVDVLVNNAGWDRAGNFLNTDKKLWDQIVAVNLYGALFMHYAVLKGMSERGSGRVVNIASDAARVGSTGEAVYAFCKGGLIAFSKTLARELARKQISINVVCPGPTDTPLLRDVFGEGERADKMRTALTRAIPFGRLGRPDDLPGIVAFLASDDAAFITGQVVSVSGGLTMVG